jgi:hypothetical protein
MNKKGKEMNKDKTSKGLWEWEEIGKIRGK